MNFLPEASHPHLIAEINEWNEKLALLRGDNIYDVARLYFSSKGWNANQVKVEVDVTFGNDSRANDERIVSIVKDKMLAQRGLKFIKTLMGRLICSETAILGAIVNPTSSITKATYDIIGTKPLIKYMKEQFEEHLKPLGVPHLTRLTISDNKIVSTLEKIPLGKKVKDINMFYPYMDRGPIELMDAFMKSESNVLLLIGPPGTGKTNFISTMMEHRGWDENVTMADREDVLMHVALSDHMRGLNDGAIMITEDSDKMVAKREDGNSSMNALLNTSDGVVKRNVKIIISTNLESLTSVDKALTRPGRCFDIVQFKLLTQDQAHAIRDMMELPNVEFDNSNDVTLATALNQHEINPQKVKRAGGMGFHAA